MPSWRRYALYLVREMTKDAHAIRKEIILIQKLAEDLFATRNSLV